MRAIQLDQFGPPENYKIIDAPIPVPAKDQVLIKVEVAGIIFADTQMRRGDYVNLADLPFIPGREVAGTIQETGDNAGHLKPGMRVMARVHTGGYAEYTAASAKDVFVLPDRVSFSEGIVYHINLRIAHLYYYTFGQVQPDQTILVHAAAGGIGTLIIQIAKRRANNIVIALASSDEKLEYCKSNGADYGINYNTTDYVEEVLRITGGKGVDVSLNSVGGPTLITDPLAIRPLGRWLIYGYAAGKGMIDPYEVIMPKSLTVSINSVYTVWDREEYRQATDFMMNWLHTEELDSVSRSFKLEEIVEAHHWIEGQHSIGKIALVM